MFPLFKVVILPWKLVFPLQKLAFSLWKLVFSYERWCFLYGRRCFSHGDVFAIEVGVSPMEDGIFAMEVGVSPMGSGISSMEGGIFPIKASPISSFGLCAASGATNTFVHNPNPEPAIWAGQWHLSQGSSQRS